MPTVSKNQKRSDSKWYCYTLASSNCNHTYVGKTNDLQRRIRQHNGTLKGGAKATRGKGPWFFAYYVSGFSNERESLQLEWRLHNPPGGRKKRHLYRGILGRFKALLATLNLPRWTRSSPHSSECKLTVHWRPEFKFILDKYHKDFPSHVSHTFIDNMPTGHNN